MAALTFAAYPAMASVSGTPHDFTGSGGFGLCQVCHVPHAASSTTNKRLWRTNVTITTGASWDQSVVGDLCAQTCHNSAPNVSTANSQGTTAHNVVPTVYAASSHGRTWATLKNTHTPGADQNIGDKVATASQGRPYYNQTYMECTSCHNPHDDSLRPFLRKVAGETTISQVCGGCHNRYSTSNGTTNIGLNNKGPQAPSDTTDTNSMHPVDISLSDLSGNNEAATGAATQFHEPPAALETVVPDTKAWVLGGKFQIAGGGPVAAVGAMVGNNAYQIGCQTCHSIHAPAASTGDNSQSLYLLAIDNEPSGANAGAPLCEGCHGGGYNGTTNGQFVAAPYTATDANGKQLDDHPIDAVVDGAPKLEAWGSTTRYERVPSGAPSVWPFVNSGTYVPTVNAANFGSQHIGRIICTSCHSAHNANGGTSLNRLNGAGTSPATGWCFSCHTNNDMVPGNHHSTTYQESTNTGGNWSSTSTPAGASKIQCTDCHGAAASAPTAHAGFFSLKMANDSSQLCVSCHGDSTNGLQQDPVRGVINYGSTVPNGHLSAISGQTAGTEKTHYIGTIITNGANSINVKTGYWMQAVNNGRGASYSKYGGSGTDTHNSTAPTVTAGTSKIVCESCHAVLYNCGDGSLSGGYMVNLLLQNYEDNKQGATDGSILGTSVAADNGSGVPSATPYTYTAGGSGVGSGFCVACHNNGTTVGAGTNNGFVAHSVVNTPSNVPSNMHPMTGWTITRAVDAGRATTTLITGAGSYADQTVPAAAPNAGSYDGANAMSCDGCHRPHMAATNGVWTPGYEVRSVSVILESASPTARDYGTLCEQCHSM